MTVYIILVIFAVFFTWLQQVGAMKNGMKLSYFLVFLFLALRYDYGNDYSSYFNGYLRLQSLQDEDFYFKGNEVGWLYLNYFFKYVFGDIGFHIMLANIAAFTCFVLYRLTTKYIPPKYYAFAIALLLLESNNILVLSSAMRQSIAVGIFLLSFDYLLQRKYLYYFAGIVLASFFHTSALIFIVLIVLNIVNWRIYLPYVFLVFFGLFFLLNNLDYIFDQVNVLLESQESVYLAYLIQGKEKNKYGLGFALYVFIYLSVLIVNRKTHYNIEQNTIVKIVIVMLFLSILGIAVQMAGRLSFYIFPLVVTAYSLTLLNLEKFKFDRTPIFSRLSILIIVVFFTYQNYMFWQSEVYSPYFLEYKTIFQSPLLK
ncbi:MAG: EpsG family protein [Bacteroidetes bacterium]|nr:EpsG family protein [Bacteroidota bacterium]